MALSTLAVITAVNDALTLASALTPLVQQAMAAGQTEISDEEVAAARARLGDKIDALDALIAASGGTPPGG